MVLDTEHDRNVRELLKQFAIDNNGKEYDLEKGWFDPALQRHIHPGTEINCRCSNKPVFDFESMKLKRQQSGKQ